MQNQVKDLVPPKNERNTIESHFEHYNYPRDQVKQNPPVENKKFEAYEPSAKRKISNEKIILETKKDKAAQLGLVDHSPNYLVQNN